MNIGDVVHVKEVTSIVGSNSFIHPSGEVGTDSFLDKIVGKSGVIEQVYQGSADIRVTSDSGETRIVWMPNRCFEVLNI